MALDVEDKTERPTERRRRQAREEGLGPRSPDLTTACRLLGIAAAMHFFGARLILELSQFLTDSLKTPFASELTSDMVVSYAWNAILRLALPAVGCCGCLWGCCLAGHFLQVGFRFQIQDVLPDFSRLSPERGLSRLWRLENVSQAMWGLIKYATIVTFGGWYLWSTLGRLSMLSESDLGTIAQVAGQSLVTLAWLLAAVFLLFGLGDYGYQIWKFEQSLKMSPAELREEARNDGGNPQWKERRRELWQQRSSGDVST